MTDFKDGEAFDRACDERRVENERYLEEFETWLRASGLSDKTVNKHLDNVDFFINTYLIREDACGIDEGPRLVDDFLGYFFIHKCMWSTPETIRENAASFKKFYKCMFERGHVSKESYDLMLSNIKEGLPIWIEDCEAYNDPSSDLDIFGESVDRDLFDAAYDIVARSLGLDTLLDLDETGDEPDADGELMTRQDAINTLTLALFYLTSWEEDGAGGRKVRRAWKSADWDAVDSLREQGFIDCTNKAKSVYLTDSGCAEAREYVRLFGFDYLLEDD